MSAPALIRKEDMRRAAEIAVENGCRIEIKIGDAVVSITPFTEPCVPAPIAKDDGIDYSRPVL